MEVQIIRSNVLLVGVLETTNRENRRETFFKEMKQEDFLGLKDVNLYLESTHKHPEAMNHRWSLPTHIFKKSRASETKKIGRIGHIKWIKIRMASDFSTIKLENRKQLSNQKTFEISKSLREIISKLEFHTLPNYPSWK